MRHATTTVPPLLALKGPLIGGLWEGRGGDAADPVPVDDLIKGLFSSQMGEEEKRGKRQSQSQIACSFANP